MPPPPSIITTASCAVCKTRFVCCTLCGNGRNLKFVFSDSTVNKMPKRADIQCTAPLHNSSSSSGDSGEERTEAAAAERTPPLEQLYLCNDCDTGHAAENGAAAAATTLFCNCENCSAKFISSSNSSMGEQQQQWCRLRLCPNCAPRYCTICQKVCDISTRPCSREGCTTRECYDCFEFNDVIGKHTVGGAKVVSYLCSKCCCRCCDGSGAAEEEGSLPPLLRVVLVDVDVDRCYTLLSPPPTGNDDDDDDPCCCCQHICEFVFEPYGLKIQVKETLECIESIMTGNINSSSSNSGVGSGTVVVPSAELLEQYSQRTGSLYQHLDDEFGDD